MNQSESEMMNDKFPLNALSQCTIINEIILVVQFESIIPSSQGVNFVNQVFLNFIKLRTWSVKYPKTA